MHQQIQPAKRSARIGQHRGPSLRRDKIRPSLKPIAKRRADRVAQDPHPRRIEPESRDEPVALPVAQQGEAGKQIAHLGPRQRLNGGLIVGMLYPGHEPRIAAQQRAQGQRRLHGIEQHDRVEALPDVAVRLGQWQHDHPPRHARHGGIVDKLHLMAAAGQLLRQIAERRLRASQRLPIHGVDRVIPSDKIDKRNVHGSRERGAGSRERAGGSRGRDRIICRNGPLGHPVWHGAEHSARALNRRCATRQRQLLEDLFQFLHGREIVEERSRVAAISLLTSRRRSRSAAKPTARSTYSAGLFAMQAFTPIAR